MPQVAAAELAARRSISRAIDWGWPMDADRSLVSVQERCLENLFAVFRQGTTFAGLKQMLDGVKGALESANGKHSVETFDKTLISIGRCPHIAGLRMKNAAVIPLLHRLDLTWDILPPDARH